MYATLQHQPHVLTASWAGLRAFWPGSRQLSLLAAEVAHVSIGTAVLALLLTTSSFATLGGIELLAVYGLTRKSKGCIAVLPKRDVFRVSFLAHAVSHCVGGVAMSMAIRMRLYTRRGWSVGDVAKVIAASSAAIWAGATLTVLAATPMIGNTAINSITTALHNLTALRHPRQGEIIAAAVLACAVIVALVVALIRLRANRHPASEPATSLAPVFTPTDASPLTSTAVRVGIQVLLAACDWIFCAMILFLFLPRHSVSFPLCVSVFIVANAAGALTHAPGGLGAFDVVVLAILGPLAGVVPAAAALVLYRVIYYGVPLALAAGVSVLSRSLRAAPVCVTLPTTPERLRLAPLIAAAPSTTAHLALVGDKGILFNDQGTAFLMYGISGRTWVAMGDPVGTATEQMELVQRFRRMAAEHHGRPVFYHVTPATLYLYTDVSLVSHKIGECARVPLHGFSLDGQARRWLRRSRKHAITAGCSIEFVAQPDVAPLLPTLRRVSDEWLQDKRSREKCFSLGYFDAAYLRNCPMAVVRCGGRVVAFANIWTSGGNEEVSVDLMRYAPESPDGVIDYLLSEIMLWASQRNFAWFDLGVAPLAGVEGGRGAPLWDQLASWMYRRGNRFYSFEGLRRYKAKYDPTWEPRYVVLPARASAAVIAADVARLIGGGARRTAARQAAA
ncbi:MAG: phosphatidylglycerol lysyltransferase domain-containing protein [Gemmatimonadaceae bacterium]